MKAEIEAKIAELEAALAAKKQAMESEVAALEAAIVAERAKLTSWVEAIPAELHNLTQEMFDRLARFFGYSPSIEQPAAPAAVAPAEAPGAPQ